MLQNKSVISGWCYDAALNVFAEVTCFYASGISCSSRKGMEELRSVVVVAVDRK
jgi:hypothetical protein